MSTPVSYRQHQPGGAGDEYVTAPEAARLLKVSLPTVWRWIKAEKLPAIRVGERSVRIKRADLARVIRPAIEHREGVTEVPQRERGAIPTHRTAPLSDEEVRHRLAALDRLQAAADQLQAERGGKLMPSSTDLIREGREELSSRP